MVFISLHRCFEWVEAPNTIGMSQFADGGVVASKPYVSSGAYINKMSNYCKSCKFKVAEKVGKTLVHSMLFIGIFFPEIGINFRAIHAWRRCIEPGTG